MKTLLLGWMLVMTTWIAMPTVVQAQGGQRIERMAKFLNLSPQQVTQIKSIMYESRRQQITTQAQLQLARLDLSQLVNQHRPDLKAVSAALDKVGQIELTLKKSRVMMMLRMKALLSKEQADKLQEFNARRAQRRQRWRQGYQRWMRNQQWRQRRWRQQGGGDPSWNGKQPNDPPAPPAPPARGDK